MAKNKDDLSEDIQISDDTNKPEPREDLRMEEPDTTPEPEEKADDSTKETASSPIPVEQPSNETTPPTTPTSVGKKTNKLKLWVITHKKLSIILGFVLALVIAAAIIGFTDLRFVVMNLFFKATADVTVVDEKSHQPIPNAKVTIAGKNAQTDKKGVAKLTNVPFGSQNAKVEKEAYSTLQKDIRIESSPQKLSFDLHPTGTPLSFVLTNKISNAPIKGVKVTFGASDAVSDDKGLTTLNVPPQTVADVEVKLSADGYNDAAIKVKIDPSAKNNAALTPSGKVYFLSKRTGKINVMSSNLDGTNQAVVIPGTGKESDLTTTLLASRDWKFLALKASRDTSKEAVYLIDTSNNQMTTIDEGDASFTSVGWHDHDFVYTVDRNTVQYWQPNKLALKSYSADAKNLRTLDQNGAEGTQPSYTRQDIDNFYIVKDGLVYSRSWSGATHPAEIVFTSTDGKQKKTVKTFDGVYGLQARLYEPEGIYFAAYNGGTTAYYEYEDGSVKNIQISDADFNSKFYPTYLISPSGNSTYWYEPRDGKNFLQIGDANGKNSKEISPASEFVAYGWYSDNYLLASKSSSELYILPKTGIASTDKALKITDYHKPQVNFTGYGYGYGGF